MILAIDAGGTKTVAALFDTDGRELGRARAGPGNVYRDPEAAGAALVDVSRALVRDRSRVQACAGVAGLSAAGSVARVRAALPGFARLDVVSDGYAALAGAFGAGPGALIVVGTGVAGIARDAAGAMRTASGWGFPAGDRGGGAWLGFSLVQAWLERMDGYDQPDSALWDVVAARAGTGRTAVLAWLRGAGPAEFAALAPAILAARDAVSERLLRAATDHITALAAALLRRVSGEMGQQLALGGGLAPVMAPRLHGYAVTLDADPLLGALRIARGEVGGVDPTI